MSRKMKMKMNKLASEQRGDASVGQLHHRAMVGRKFRYIAQPSENAVMHSEYHSGPAMSEV